MQKTVYLIDKDPAVIDMIALMLADEGYKAIIATKPFAISELLGASPALIILHNGLDDMGVRICREIKTEPRTRNIPVIMSSTNANLSAISKTAGADAFIQKPFDLDEFCALIKNTLSKLP